MYKLALLAVVVAATMLAPVAATAAEFNDVPPDHPFHADIAWLATEGITKGCNPPANDRFCPDGRVTRGQMAAFLVRALDINNPGTVAFVDDDNSVFEDDIAALGAAGITHGCNPPANDQFCPDDPVTRAEMAAFIGRALGLSAASGDPFNDDDGSIFEADIERLAAAGITKGCNPPTNDHFCPDDIVTRGQMAAFLQRALTMDDLLGIEIIPSSRRVDWDPGIPGGIPNPVETTSVTDHGAVGNGSTNDLQPFIDAVASLPESGGVVSIPAGVYRIDGTIRLRDGVVLRGAGADVTFLRFDLGGTSSSAIEAVTYERGDWRALAGDAGRGATTVTLANTTGITAPGFAEIQQTNNPTIMYTDSAWDVDWAEGSVGEMVRIVAVSGDQVTLAEPLLHDYDPDQAPQLRPLGLVEYTGVESLHIERLDSGDGPTITFKNTAYAWVRDVVSVMTVRAHIDTSSVYRCEIRESQFIDSHDHGGGGHGYGASLSRHTTGCLIENNIFESLRHSMIIQVGAAGNVFGYNFSTDSHNNSGNLLPDIALHGHYPAMNLFEGNIVEEIGIGDWWGPAGPGNTMLRNCVTVEGVFAQDASHTQNIVGNVLLGSPDEVFIHASVSGTLLHGNIEAGSVRWDPGITTKTIPASLYLDSAPAFYESADWPSIGPDVSGVCENPARLRWQIPTP